MLQINNRVHFNVMNINKYHEATTIILKIIYQIFKEKKNCGYGLHLSAVFLKGKTETLISIAIGSGPTVDCRCRCLVPVGSIQKSERFDSCCVITNGADVRPILID